LSLVKDTYTEKMHPQHFPMHLPEASAYTRLT